MTVRPIRPGDEAAIAAIFWATVVLGSALDAAPPDGSAYQSLCLDWYLGAGRDGVAVFEEPDGTISGYALTCTDPRHHARWTRRAALRFGLRAAASLAAGRHRPPVAAFYRDRLRDGWDMRHRWRSPDGLGHAHVNLLPGARTGAAGRLFLDHVDQVMVAAGLQGWYGEINATRGRRARALQRLGGSVVACVPNRTLTNALGRPVDRLTVVWRCSDAPHRRAA